MTTPTPFRKSAFDFLRRRRDSLFTRANNGSECVVTVSGTPNGLIKHVCQHTRKTGSILLLGNSGSEVLQALVGKGFAVTSADWSPLALAATEDVRHTGMRADAAGANAIRVDGQPMAIADGSLDGIVITGLLPELGHPVPLLKECSRLLANNGSLTVVLPDNLAAYHPEHAVLWTAPTLRDALGLLFERTYIKTENESLIAHASNAKTTRHPVIFAMMNIRNEDRWLREVLDNAARICDGIVVYDDGSTDGTPDICQTHPAVVAYQRVAESQTDKARDKNRLLGMAREFLCDWILCIDGDELLELSAPRRILETLDRCSAHVAQIDFEFLYLWNDRQHVRTDGIYTGIFHPCLFRPISQSWTDLNFQPTSHGGNLHCERTPHNLYGERIRADIKIEHLGYLLPEDRLRKYKWNTSKDPKHANEGYYEHLQDQPGMTLAPWDGRPDTGMQEQSDL